MAVNDQREEGLWTMAARNGGVFSYADARRAGLTPRQIRYRQTSGLWVAIFAGVYRFAATPETESVRAAGALRLCGSTALFARRSAGELWQLDRVRAVRPELVVPYERHPRAVGLVVMRSKRLGESDRASRQGLPVTAIERTIIDLAAVLNDEDLECALHSAWRQGLTNSDRIVRRLTRLDGPGRAGAGRLRRLLRQLSTDTPLESPLEVKVARLLRTAGIAEPIAQFPIGWYRADFAWPDAKLVLECDGRQYHRDFDADRARWSAIAGAGWRVIFLTWKEATREGAAVVTRVRTALNASLTGSQPPVSHSRH